MNDAKKDVKQYLANHFSTLIIAATGRNELTAEEIEDRFSESWGSWDTYKWGRENFHAEVKRLYAQIDDFGQADAFANPGKLCEAVQKAVDEYKPPLRTIEPAQD